jgi:hypothetical protein
MHSNREILLQSFNNPDLRKRYDVTTGSFNLLWLDHGGGAA